MSSACLFVTAQPGLSFPATFGRLRGRPGGTSTVPCRRRASQFAYLSGPSIITGLARLVSSSPEGPARLFFARHRGRGPSQSSAVPFWYAAGADEGGLHARWER